VLLLGMIGLTVGPAQVENASIAWETLLAPYSQGAELPDGFRLGRVRCGPDNDIVISAERPRDSAAVEVHVLPRGRWPGIRESQSFGIGYETQRSDASGREAVTEALAQAIRSHDRGLPSPDTIPLGPSLVASGDPAWVAALHAVRPLLVGASVAALLLIVAMRSRALTVMGLGVGIADLIARGAGFWVVQDQTCAGHVPAEFIDLGVRAIQLGWVLLILSSPLVCWRAGRAVGLGGRRMMLVVAVSALVAVVAIWHRRDAPLHANGHAWREAREVLMPWGERSTDTAPFLHGRGAIALQWLVAGAERTLTGSANPFRVSRLAVAAAAGATALLTAILVRSTAAGLAAGCVLALMPLAHMLALSGSPLAIPAWLLPWSLALLIAAAASCDRLLLAGAVLAAGLGTLSHTAMLAWPPALLAAWLVGAGRECRRTRFAVGALLMLAAAWVVEALDVHAMLADRSAGSGIGLPTAALLGFLHSNLMADPHWVSPLLLPCAVLWVAVGLWQRRFAMVAASMLPLLIVAAPFFAVTACSSDAVRYQGALLGLITSIAVAGIWAVTGSRLWGAGAGALLRGAALAGLALLPPRSWQPPIDPAVVEHRLVERAVGQMQPGTLVILPESRLHDGRVLADFPDFVLPANSSVAFAGDPRIKDHTGPELFYLGLACISWDAADGGPDATGMRPECRSLRAHAHPWVVHTLRPEDLPRRGPGVPWTFHQLATGVPFGFFAPD
jgi:hypothetical protein